MMHRSKPVYFYVFIGMVIGWVTSLVSFVYIGVNALWSLAVFGIMCMFLGCFHYYTKANNLPQKTMGSKENKSLLSKVRVWEK